MSILRVLKISINQTFKVWSVRTLILSDIETPGFSQLLFISEESISRIFFSRHLFVVNGVFLKGFPSGFIIKTENIFFLSRMGGVLKFKIFF